MQATSVLLIPLVVYSAFQSVTPLHSRLLPVITKRRRRRDEQDFMFVLNDQLTELGSTPLPDEVIAGIARILHVEDQEPREYTIDPDSAF